MPELHKMIKFKGEFYWLHETAFGFNISPLDHYSNDGELTANPFTDISYAVLEEDGMIRRYGEVIGKKEDLEDVK